jgi:predicted RNase H-like nuclease
MNGDEPLSSSPHHEEGQAERLDLIRAKLPGVDDVISRVPPVGAGIVHLYEAAAMLWTARRASGRAIARMPMDPEWDEGGIRIELVR